MGPASEWFQSPHHHSNENSDGLHGPMYWAMFVSPSGTAVVPSLRAHYWQQPSHRITLMSDEYYECQHKHSAKTSPVQIHKRQRRQVVQAIIAFGAKCTVAAHVRLEQPAFSKRSRTHRTSVDHQESRVASLRNRDSTAAIGTHRYAL